MRGLTIERALTILCVLAIGTLAAAATQAADSRGPGSRAFFSGGTGTEGRAAAEIVPHVGLENLILAALAERRVDVVGAFIELYGASAQLAVPTNARVSVERISYQPAGQRFTAVLAAAPQDAAPQRVTVAGRLQREIDVPVPNRRIRAGEVIGAGDVQWVAMREQTIPDSAVGVAEEMIGRTPRRNLAPGAPVLAGDLKRPAIIAKGAPVMLVLIQPNMRLTARGRSLEEGGVGDTIRVINEQSRMNVVGVILPDGQVAVGSPTRQPSR